ncbi:hypothetical protein AB6846_11560 [Serratia proteamaculans]
MAKKQAEVALLVAEQLLALKISLGRARVAVVAGRAAGRKGK